MTVKTDRDNHEVEVLTPTECERLRKNGKKKEPAKDNSFYKFSHFSFS